MKVLLSALAALLLVAGPALAGHEAAPAPPAAAAPAQHQKQQQAQQQRQSVVVKNSVNGGGNGSGDAASSAPSLGIAIQGECTGTGFGISGGAVSASAALQVIKLNGDCQNIRNAAALELFHAPRRIVAQILSHLGENHVVSVRDAISEVCTDEPNHPFCPPK